jgi:hypothetical protein
MSLPTNLKELPIDPLTKPLRNDAPHRGCIGNPGWDIIDFNPRPSPGPPPGAGVAGCDVVRPDLVLTATTIYDLPLEGPATYHQEVVDQEGTCYATYDGARLKITNTAACSQAHILKLFGLCITERQRYQARRAQLATFPRPGACPIGTPGCTCYAAVACGVAALRNTRRGPE